MRDRFLGLAAPFLQTHEPRDPLAGSVEREWSNGARLMVTSLQHFGSSDLLRRDDLDQSADQDRRRRSLRPGRGNSGPGDGARPATRRSGRRRNRHESGRREWPAPWPPGSSIAMPAGWRHRSRTCGPEAPPCPRPAARRWPGRPRSGRRTSATGTPRTTCWSRTTSPASSTGSRLGLEVGRRALDDGHLFVGAGVADRNIEHEPVELGFGQRVRSLLFDRVLGGDHEERRSSL